MCELWGNLRTAPASGAETESSYSRMTQEAWEKLVAFATSLRILDPEDAVQSAIMEDIEKHGKPTAYTRFLVMIRAPNYRKRTRSIRTEVPFQLELHGGSEEQDLDHYTVKEIMAMVSSDTDTFSDQEMVVLYDQVEGFSMIETAKFLKVSRIRVFQIWKQLIEKLKVKLHTTHGVQGAPPRKAGVDTETDSPRHGLIPR